MEYSAATENDGGLHLFNWGKVMIHKKAKNIYMRNIYVLFIYILFLRECSQIDKLSFPLP